MLKFSEIFEFSRENSYFERIRMVRMVRMVRSLADRTFQLWIGPPAKSLLKEVDGRGILRTALEAQRLEKVATVPPIDHDATDEGHLIKDTNEE